MSSSSSSSSSPGGPAVRRAAAAALAAGALLGVSALPAAAALDAEVSDASNVVVRPVGRAALDVPDTPTTRTDSTGALVGEVVVDTAFTAGVLAAAVHESRYQARVLAGIAARDAAAAADPRARRLAEKLGGLGITPAVHPEGGWRQQAVDVSDHLNALQARGVAVDPVLDQAAVALAAAGYGPTPADLLPTTPPAPPVPVGEDPPGPVSGLGDAAAQMTGAVESAAQAVTTATAAPAPARPASVSSSAPAAAPSAAPANAALDPAPQKAPTPAPVPAQVPEPAAPRAGLDQDVPDTDDPVAGDAGAGDGDGAWSREATGSASDSAPQPVSSVSGTSDDAAASVSDRESARAAVSLLTDLLTALDTTATTATGDAGGADGDAAGLRSALGAVLDRDRLAQLGADPDDLADLADLDKIDKMTSDNDGSGPGRAGRTDSSDSSDSSIDKAGTGRSDVSGTDTSTTSTVDTSTTATSTAGTTSSSGETGGEPGGSGGSARAAGGWESVAARLAVQAEQAAAADPLAAELAATLADLDLDPSTTTRTGGDAGSAETSSAETRVDDDTGEVVTRGESGNDHSEPEPEPEVPSGDTGDSADSAAGDDPADGGGVEASTWDRLADCEAGGDWAANTGNGYQGGLQFSPSTWKAHGGQGAAHEASREQQIVVAEKVLAAQGWAAWPACSKRLGLGGGRE